MMIWNSEIHILHLFYYRKQLMGDISTKLPFKELVKRNQKLK